MSNEKITYNPEKQINPSESEENITELIGQAKNGDKKAFTKLYNIYNRDLYAFIISKTHSPSKTEDILQSTWLKVWNKLDTFKDEVNFKSWLFSITYNTIMDTFRKEKRTKEKEYEEFKENIYPDTSTIPNNDQLFDNAIDEARIRDKINQAIETLTEREQAIIKGRVAGKSVAKLAQEEGIKSNTVASIIFRIKQKLRNIFEE